MGDSRSRACSFTRYKRKTNFSHLNELLLIRSRHIYGLNCPKNPHLNLLTSLQIIAVTTKAMEQLGWPSVIKITFQSMSLFVFQHLKIIKTGSKVMALCPKCETPANILIKLQACFQEKLVKWNSQSLLLAMWARTWPRRKEPSNYDLITKRSNRANGW